MGYSPDRLNELAEKVGILPSFVDRTTNITYHADDQSKQAILKSLGLLAETDEDIEASFLKLKKEEYESLIDQTILTRESEQSNLEINVRLLKDEAETSLIWQIKTEAGEVFEDEVPLELLEVIKEEVVEDKVYQVRQLCLALEMEMGYHVMSVSLKVKSKKAKASLIIVPDKCYMPTVLEEEKKVFGYPIQLYSLKSKTNWGIGDYSDLKKMVDVSIKTGAAFIGVNPLTALFQDNPDDASPYFPCSRMFLNPIYVDMEIVPEAKENEEIEELKSCPIFKDHLLNARKANTVDYQKVAAIKKQAFKILFKKFRETHFDE